MRQSTPKSLGVIALAMVAVGLQAQVAVNLTIDVNRNRKPINPLIYGVAYGTASQLSDLNAPLNRMGGNPTSRYNYQQNVDNRGADWYFESIPYASSTQNGEHHTFVQNSKNGGAQPMLTVPMIDWVAKTGPNRTKLASFAVSKYGAQQYSDPGWSNAGNGVKPNGQFVAGNDKNDANTPNSTTFQRGWMDNLIARWGAGANGGVRYYLLDNEPSIWHYSHRDVQPEGLKMRDARQKMIDYATMIKTRDPQAIVLGPEEWGWSGFFYSGFDQQAGQNNGWTFYPDRASNGNMDYAPYLLREMRSKSQQVGRRLLDYFSLHYYPQGGEFSDDVTSAMQLRRNRSTRSLWDPGYTDESWIADKVKLIPRMRGWVNSYYSGTPIALTEYNWGAERHINGATAQADILGIFGREGLDLANRWTTPPTNSMVYNAMKMYRNYDGRKSTFGDTSVYATSPNPDDNSIFAATRSADSAVTIMVINKRLTASINATINLTNITGDRNVTAYQLTSSNRITTLSPFRTRSGKITATLPKQSITLFVVARN